MANKADCFSEQKVPAELSDACILAQKENLPILTEDFFYLKMNELETKKIHPQYFSSLAILQILYESELVGFDEYLDFFSYLSYYRFRFLSLSCDDIEKTIFGDSKIKRVSIKNIKKLNFPLILSEEYGVSFQEVFRVVKEFIFKIILDNAVTPDIAEKIFIEIINNLPIRGSKEDFGQKILRSCLREIEDNKFKFILYPKDQIIYEKINNLFFALRIFSSGIISISNTKDS